MIVFSFLVRILQILTARFVFLQNRGRVMAIQNKSVLFYATFLIKLMFHSLFFFNSNKTTIYSLMCILLEKASYHLFYVFCYVERAYHLFLSLLFITTDKATICSCTLHLSWTSLSGPCAVPTAS